jgi:hypothetical protein
MFLLWLLQVSQRLSSIVDFWGERGVFSPAAVAQLRQVVASSTAPGSAPPMQQAPAAPQPGSSRWGPPPPLQAGAPPPAAAAPPPTAQPPLMASAAAFPAPHMQPHMPPLFAGGAMPPPYAAFPPPDLMPRPHGWGDPSMPHPMPGGCYFSHASCSDLECFCGTTMMGGCALQHRLLRLGPGTALPRSGVPAPRRPRWPLTRAARPPRHAAACAGVPGTWHAAGRASAARFGTPPAPFHSCYLSLEVLPSFQTLPGLLKGCPLRLHGVC